MTVSQTPTGQPMTAVVIDRTGGTEVLRLRDVPVPTPGRGEVLVDVHAAGVNFIDTYVRSGLYATELPHVLGREGAGTVAAVGTDVTGLAAGDRVAWSSSPGAYAERTLVPAELLVPVPDDLDLPTAAAAMLQGMTAHYLARSIVSLEVGDTALVHAGAG